MSLLFVPKRSGTTRKIEEDERGEPQRERMREGKSKVGEPI